MVKKCSTVNKFCWSFLFFNVSKCYQIKIAQSTEFCNVHLMRVIVHSHTPIRREVLDLNPDA